MYMVILAELESVKVVQLQMLFLTLLVAISALVMTLFLGIIVWYLLGGIVFIREEAKLVPGSEAFRETPESGYDIEIGEGCFIGSGVIILAPVKIGDNVIIGSGSLVVKDIPSNCFAAGAPAKLISFHKTD